MRRIICLIQPLLLRIQVPACGMAKPVVRQDNVQDRIFLLLCFCPACDRVCHFPFPDLCFFPELKLILEAQDGLQVSGHVLRRVPAMLCRQQGCKLERVMRDLIDLVPVLIKPRMRGLHCIDLCVKLLLQAAVFRLHAVDVLFLSRISGSRDREEPACHDAKGVYDGCRHAKSQDSAGRGYGCFPVPSSQWAFPYAMRCTAGYGFIRKRDRASGGGMLPAEPFLIQPLITFPLVTFPLAGLCLLVPVVRYSAFRCRVRRHQAML